jgi:hypothetical protein
MLQKNFCFCPTHKSSVSTGFAGQIMPILHILCCNGCLVTWTVVSLTTAKFKPLIVKVKVTLRLTVSQSVSLGVEPHVGLMTRYLLLFDSLGLVFVGHPLWWEDGPVCCICCWPSPAQSFSGPSPLDLASIFYCVRFESLIFSTSLPYIGPARIAQKIFSSIACSLVGGEAACTQSCSLATAVVLSPVYTVFTWQRFYMPQYQIITAEFSKFSASIFSEIGITAGLTARDAVCKM